MQENTQFHKPLKFCESILRYESIYGLNRISAQSIGIGIGIGHHGIVPSPINSYSWVASRQRSKTTLNHLMTSLLPYH